jgi:hypothetical protein
MVAMRGRVTFGIVGLLALGAVRLVAGCVGDDASGSSTTDGGGGGEGGVPPTKVCNGVTVPTNDPKTGCANTDCNPCPSGANQTASCDNGGKCAATCNAGFDDCDPGVPGCETPVNDDAKNCGKCGHVCGTSPNTASSTCAAGKCVFKCNDPYLHCGADDSLGCDTNVGIDKNNCAACGHSCQGGDCISGKCQTVLLAGNPAQPMGLKSLYGIAVAGTQLFGPNWYQPAGAVYKLPTSGVDGGAVTWIVKAPVDTDGGVGGFPDGTSAPCSTTGILNDGTGKILYGVFRQDANGPAPGIWEISTTGTLNRHLVKLPNGENIRAMAADASYIYFSQFYPFGGANKRGVFRADRMTGANVTRYFYDDALNNKGEIDSIYAEGGSVYLSDNATKKIYAASPTTLNTPIELATTIDPPGSVQTDATYVYYHDANKFFRVKKVGGTAPEDITPTPGLPGTIAAFLVDDKYVYFFSPKPADLNVDNNQKLYAFPKGMKSPDPPFVIAIVGNDNLSALTQDTNTIYWTTYGRDVGPPPYSAIYKVAKPVK